MDSKIKELLERFAQRLIDNNARSRTYFVSTLKDFDTIDLYQYTKAFSPTIHLSNSIIKHNKITYAYKIVTPTNLKDALSEAIKAKGIDFDINDVKSFKEKFTKENVLKHGFTKDLVNKTVSELITNLSEKDLTIIFNCFVKSDNNNLNDALVMICDKYNEISKNKFLAIDTLNNNAKNIEKESARTELYIGYPFIEGTFFSGKTFRAPLLLHGVVIESTPNLKTIKFTDEVYLNPVFMISYVVENKMPHQRFNFDLSEATDVIKVATKYLKDKLNLELDLTKINKLASFNSVSKQTYDNKYKLYPGEYKVLNNVIIGIFPISSRAIYYDLRNIIDIDTINPLLKSFLSKHQKDAKIDEYFGQNDELETREDKIAYITENDITQKMIIRDSASQNMVIQGPPGTGKSQTIVNAIASNVVKGKTILVVSEKKTAIDVIFNRLDKLSNFACIIRNIESDKLSFYNHLLQTLDGIKKTELDDKKKVKLNQKNKAINKFFSLLNKYGILVSSDYDGYSFDEIATFKDVADKENTKELVSKIKYFKEKYPSFTEIIAKVYKGDYLDSFYKLKKELNSFKTYELLHYDIKTIETVKRILTLDISISQKRALFNRAYYNMPIDDYKKLKNTKVSKEIKTLFNTISSEIINLNLDVFKDGDVLYLDPEVLDFITNNKFSLDEATNIYKRVLYEDAIKSYKDALKFIQNYDEEADQVTKAIKDKCDLSIDEVTRSIVSKIVRESEANRDVFESIKELERLSNLQRKKSIAFTVEKNFKALTTLYPIWLLTPDVASAILPCSGDLFDLVIFDEASQMFVENSIGVLYRAKRCIVAGDSKQLRPLSIFQTRYVEDDATLDSEKMEKVNVAALEEESLLDYASHKFIERSLRYHYRSEHKNLIEFSSSAFYQNKLYFASSNKQYSYKPVEVMQVAGGQWEDGVNTKEADEVISKLVEIIKTKNPSDSVGIITFNEPQRKLFEKKIEKLVSTTPDEELKILLNKELNRIDPNSLEDTSLFIKNIENVQGDERDIIIFSVTYAKNKEGKLNTNFGLLSMASGENRLNVAITRAKKRIIVVKSFYAYELVINEDNPGPYYFKKFIEYVELASLGKEDEKHALLKVMSHQTELSEYKANIFLQNDLYFRLSKKLPNDYSIQKDIEVGSFVFDLGIYKKNKLLLCIKFDQGLANCSIFDHENDYYCDLYLISRMYKFTRVFKALYWKNPLSEIKRILTLLKIK